MIMERKNLKSVSDDLNKYSYVAKEGDYISAHSVDSLTNLAINKKINIIQGAIGDSVYNNLKPNEKWGEAYEKMADILYPM